MWSIPEGTHKWPEYNNECGQCLKEHTNSKNVTFNVVKVWRYTQMAIMYNGCSQDLKGQTNDKKAQWMLLRFDGTHKWQECNKGCSQDLNGQTIECDSTITVETIKCKIVYIDSC